MKLKQRMNRAMKGVVFGAIALLALTACNGATINNLLNRTKPTPAVPSDLPPRIQTQLRDFDFAVQSLKALYLKADSVGSKWQQVVDGERKKIIDAKDEDGNQFVSSVAAIVNALNDSSAGLSLGQAAPQPAATGQPKFSGIGILAGLPEEGRNRILVLTVYKDSPADRGGIKAHDAIVAIEGDPVTYEDRDNLIPKLRGEEGSDVTITVRTPGQKDREVTLTRRPVTPESPLISTLLPGTSIAYIAPDPSNMTGMKAQMTAALRELTAEQNIDGLILDLRIIRANDFPLNDMLSLFVNGPVATVQSRSKKEKVDIAGKSIGGSQEVPMVVLVSDQTVGQAEAFAGILQDLGRAQIVGQRTKGDMAQVTTMTLPSSRIQLLIPTGEYVGVKNNNWRGTDKGVKPNVESDKAWEDFTSENDAHVQMAIKLLTGK